MTRDDLYDAQEALERMQEDFYFLKEFFRENAPKYTYDRLKAYGIGYLDQGLNKESDYVGNVFSLEEALDNMLEDWEENNKG